VAPLADAPEVLPCSLGFFPVSMFKLPKLPLDPFVGLLSLPSEGLPSVSPAAAVVPYKA